MKKFSEYLTGSVTINDSQLLLESGFSRIMSIMAGLVPSVRTFAIITAENPMNKELTKEENLIRNEKLRKELVDAALGFVQIKGKYDKFENPFFIMNISRKEAITFGVRHEQESVLFGIVNSKSDITFQLIYCFKDEVLERHVWKSENKPVSVDFGGAKTSEEKKKRKDEEKNAASTTNFFSEYKGRRFVVPFFDTEYQTAAFKNGKIVKECRNIFYADAVNHAVVKKVEGIMDEVEILNEAVSGKHKWQYRGLAHSILADAKA